MLTAQGNLVDEDKPLLEGRNWEHDLRFLLDRVDPVEVRSEHDELVLFSTRNHPHHDYLYPLLAYPLTQHDIPCYFLFYHRQISEVFPDLILDEIQVSNSLRKQQPPYLFRSGQIGYPRFDWNVDLPNERITVSGLDVNFFHTFEATLRKDLQLYNVDYDDPEVAMKIQKGLFTADEMLRYCQLLSRYARERGLKVKFVGWETEYLPHGILYQYTESDMNQGLIEYIQIGTLYAHYFGDVGDFPYYLTASNLTMRDTSKHIAGFGEEFDEYVSLVRSSDERINRVRNEVREDLEEGILGTHKKGVDTERHSPEDLKERIQGTREKGGHVFCLFAHKFYDVGLYDYGDAFEDMSDWIQTTIDIFADRGDLLFLKPHPGEVNMATPGDEPNEKLRDFVTIPSDADNIVLLHPNGLTSFAIYEQIDCGLVWRSSVGMEMTALGIPIIVSGYPPWEAYLDFTRPGTLEEYEDMVANVNSRSIGSEQQTRAAIYFHFYKHFRHHYIPYIRNLDYSALDPRAIRWDHDLLNEYFENGDQEIDMLLDELDIDRYPPSFSVRDKADYIFENMVESSYEPAS